VTGPDRVIAILGHVWYRAGAAGQCRKDWQWRLAGHPLRQLSAQFGHWLPCGFFGAELHLLPSRAGPSGVADPISWLVAEVTKPDRDAARSNVRFSI